MLGMSSNSPREEGTKQKAEGCMSASAFAGHYWSFPYLSQHTSGREILILPQAAFRNHGNVA